MHYRSLNLSILSITLGLSLTLMGFINAQAVNAATPPGDSSNPATVEHLRPVIKASKFIGLNVVDNQKNKVGKVKDMAIDIRNNRINYVVLSMGGVGGIGDELYAMAPQAFGPIRNNDEVIMLNMSLQALKQTPSLPNKNWISAIDQNALSALYQRSGMNTPPDSAPAQLLQASDLIGQEVISQRDEKVGVSVKDLALDIQGGRVPFTILSRGGIAGVGKHLTVVPTAALSKGATKNQLRINTSGQEITNAREIDKENWESVLADPSVAAKLYTAFGIQPYWSQSVSSTSAPMEGSNSPPSRGAAQTPPAETVQGR